MSNFVIISFAFSLFVPFRSAMIVPDCEENNLILPYTINATRPLHPLPDMLIPQHYTLELEPSLPPTGDSTFKGNVKIAIRCEIPTSSITLHSLDLTILEPTVTVVNTAAQKSIPVTRIEYNRAKQFLIIHVSESLVPEFPYNVSMQYWGFLNRSTYGFYQQSYKDPVSNQTKWLAVTRFKPKGARRAFPCFDEPRLKATFDMILTRWQSFDKVVSNMPSRNAALKPGFITTEFHRSMPMSSYMVAAFVSSFIQETQNGSNIRYRMTYYHNQSVFGAVTTLISAVTYMVNFFKILYPVNHLDLVVLPESESEVDEGAGIIIMPEQTSFYIYPRTSWLEHQTMFRTRSHGVAHMWFGNMVTMKWWSDVWLIEGFAAYFGDLAAHSIIAERHVDEQFYVLHNVVALQKDCMETRALSCPCRTNDEFMRKFSDITEHKGAAIIRMMKHVLGDYTLNTGLRNYLLNNMFLTTVPDDLWYNLDNAAKSHLKITVKEFMDTWILQKGYPVVTVSRNYVTQTATITQRRFTMRQTKSSSKRKEVWHIPLTYTTQDNPNFDDTATKFWMPNNMDNVTLTMNDGVPLQSSWMIFNIQAVTYCVINYDRQNWRLLINSIESGRSQDFDFRNVAALIHDSFILAKSGVLNYNIPLDLSVTVLLKTPVHYMSWKVFDVAANELYHRLLHTNEFTNWKNYTLKIVTPHVNRTGLVEQNSQYDAMSWRIIWKLAIKAGMVDAIDDAVRLFHRIKINNATVHHGMEDVVFCAPVFIGENTSFPFLLNEYLTTTWPSHKPRYLSYLDCLKSPTHLNTLLDLALNPQSEFREVDFNQLFSIVTSSVEGKPVAINFLQNKLQQIKNRFKVNTKLKIKFMLDALASSFLTEAELNQMRSIIGQVKSVLNYKDNFSSAITTIEDNIRWMKGSFPEIQRYFR